MCPICFGFFLLKGWASLVGSVINGAYPVKFAFKLIYICSILRPWPFNILCIVYVRQASRYVTPQPITDWEHSNHFIQTPTLTLCFLLLLGHSILYLLVKCNSSLPVKHSLLVFQEGTASLVWVTVFFATQAAPRPHMAIKFKYMTAATLFHFHSLPNWIRKLCFKNWNQTGLVCLALHWPKLRWAYNILDLMPIANPC